MDDDWGYPYDLGNLHIKNIRALGAQARQMGHVPPASWSFLAQAKQVLWWHLGDAARWILTMGWAKTCVCQDVPRCATALNI